MFHLSSPQVFLLPTWVPNVKMTNGHQQGGVIDGADICGYTYQVLGNISFQSAAALVLLCFPLFSSPPFVCVSDSEQ